MTDTSFIPRKQKTLALEPAFLGALRGVWSFTWKSQLTLWRVPGLAVYVLILPVLTYLTIGDGSTQPFFRWLLDFYFLLVLPLVCLANCGAMIRDEVQADTLAFLITRPLTRARFFLIKYLCHAAWLQIIAALQLVLFFLAGNLRHIAEINSLVLLLLGTQMLAVLAWAALGSLLGVISPKYLVLGLVYGFVVEMGIGRIPTNINSLSLIRHIHTLLGNHDILNQIYDWSSKGTLFSIFVMLAATVLFLGLGAALFTFREYHHSEEMQK